MSPLHKLEEIIQGLGSLRVLRNLLTIFLIKLAFRSNKKRIKLPSMIYAYIIGELISKREKEVKRERKGSHSIKVSIKKVISENSEPRVFNKFYDKYHLKFNVKLFAHLCGIICSFICGI